MPLPTIHWTNRLFPWWLVSLGLTLSMVFAIGVNQQNWPAIFLLPVFSIFPLLPILVLRAAWMRFTGRNLDLYIYGSIWLRGNSAILIPLTLLIGLITLRELGAVELNFSRVGCKHGRSASITTRGPLPPLNDSGELKVVIPFDGPFFDALRDSLVESIQPSDRSAMMNDSSGAPSATRAVQGTLHITGDAPNCWLPLTKEDDSQLSIEGTVLVPDGARSFSVEIGATVSIRATAVGFASSRHFQVSAGRVVGQDLGTWLAAAIREARAK